MYFIDILELEYFNRGILENEYLYVMINDLNIVFVLIFMYCFCNKI